AAGSRQQAATEAATSSARAGGGHLTPSDDRPKGMTPEERSLWDLDFSIKKSIRYHARRRASFERLDNAANVIVAIFGASAFAALMGDPAALASKILTAMVTAMALADVILAFGSRARTYADLYRKFSDLAIEISQIPQPTSLEISRLRAKRLILEADEPHIIDALERVCWNEEAESRGVSREHLQPLNRWQTLVAHLSS
ncbi:MAG: hypothetical protein ACREFA_10305, partial [Stellaceae bacterium]